MTVTILRGVPYSGKSSYVRDLPRDLLVRVCSADNYHRTLDGKYDFKVENASAAHAACFREFHFSCLKNANDELHIVVDNTNIKLWEVSPYVMVAKMFGHDVRVVTITCPMDELLRRREKRPEQVVPIEVLERMLASFEPSLKAWET
jgi:predicted kinase